MRDSALSSANRAAAMLRMCAMSVGKTSTALGAFYRRLAYRVGLEFVIRPPLEAGPCPGSGRSNAHG